MSQVDRFEVVLYGATGYTGRLIAEELAAADASFAIAGRDQAKLEALELQLDGRPEIIQASVDDPAGLEAMAAQTDVLLSAAGPFKHLGPPLLDAAISKGAHFADITGEQTFLRHCLERSAEAEAAEISVVNALGFDVVPSDLAAYHACQGLGTVERLDLAIDSRARLSGGTKRSMAASTGDGWYFDGGRFPRAVPGRFIRRFSAPDVQRAPTGVFIPWGDCVTAPRTTGADVVRTFFIMPKKKARRMHLAWPLTDLLTRLPLVDRLAEMRAPGSNQGPSEEARRGATFRILADAHGSDGEVSRAMVTGRDPYGLTGAAAAKGALAMARGELDETGVLTPTQALGPGWAPKALADFDLEVKGLAEVDA